MSEVSFSEDAVLETEEDAAGTKYLMCRLGEEIYGIDIKVVTDIIELQEITALPDMPAYVKGVINLRGKVIPIIDLRLRFNMDERAYDDRTVIAVVNVRDQAVGVVVDTTTEVHDVHEADISAPPEFRGGTSESRYISGLGKLDEQVIILLDMEKLVNEKEAGMLVKSSV